MRETSAAAQNLHHASRDPANTSFAVTVLIAIKASAWTWILYSLHTRQVHHTGSPFSTPFGGYLCWFDCHLSASTILLFYSYITTTSVFLLT
jgi:hypothetical protein